MENVERASVRRSGGPRTSDAGKASVAPPPQGSIKPSMAPGGKSLVPPQDPKASVAPPPSGSIKPSMAPPPQGQEIKSSFAPPTGSIAPSAKGTLVTGSIAPSAKGTLVSGSIMSPEKASLITGSIAPSAKGTLVTGSIMPPEKVSLITGSIAPSAKGTLIAGSIAPSAKGTLVTGSIAPKGTLVGGSIIPPFKASLMTEQEGEEEEEEEGEDDEGLIPISRPSQTEGTDATTGTIAVPPSENEIDMTPMGFERKDLDKYCSEQILIPPKLPNILKQYTKAALRTQPRDLLLWTVSYFQALAEGKVPPAKETLEYPQSESKDGLTVGYMRVLNAQVGGRDVEAFSDLVVSIPDVREKWVGLCLPKDAYDEIVEAGKLLNSDSGLPSSSIEWKKLLGLLCGSIGRNLTDTMKIVCEVLTEQPEGVDASIPFIHWWDIYLFLASLDECISGAQLEAVHEFLAARAQPNFCLVGPKDFFDPKCPPLY